MKKILIFLLLLAPLMSFSPAPARGAPDDPAIEKLKKKFDTQEQIILGGLLADAAQSQTFAEDAKIEPTPEAVFLKWRVRMAAFAKDYLGRNHPINEEGKTVQQMVEPSEWGALMATTRILKGGNLGDQATFRILFRMIKNANADLKKDPPDPSEAHKIIGEVRPKFVKALQEFSESEPAKKALEAEGFAAKAKNAQEQAEKILKEAELAKNSATNEEAANRSSKGYTNEKGADGTTTVDGTRTKTEDPKMALTPAGDKKPNLTTEPPKPEDDMEELNEMGKSVAGHKALYAGGGGALLFGLIGFFVGGPIGALIGALAGGAAGYGIGKWLFG